MKSSILIKYLVFVLTAFSLVCSIGGIAGIVFMEQAGLYVNGPETLQEQQYQAIGEALADAYANNHITAQMDTCPEALQRELYQHVLQRYEQEVWGVQLMLHRQLLSQTEIPKNWTKQLQITVDSVYPIAVPYLAPAPDEAQPQDPSALPSATDPDPSEEIMPDGWLYTGLEPVWDQGVWSLYKLYYYPGPTYTVTVFLQEQVLQSSSLHMLNTLYPYRYDFVLMLAVGLIFFFAGFTFLMYAAGYASDGTVRPGGINRLPLDLHFLLTLASIFLLAWLFSFLRSWMATDGPHPGNLSLLGSTLFSMALLLLGFFCALAAQMKLKNGFWWRHSLLGFCLRKLGSGLSLLGKNILRLLRVLPMIWQWLVAVMFSLSASVLALTFFLLYRNIFIFLFAFLPFTAGTLLIVGYGAYAMGLLHQSVRQMSEGSLTQTVPTKHLIGCFRDFALALNTLSDTVVTAAQNQMRSERMKSELITNVSHDIKTPLTSIINFVDLLQKPHTPEQNEQYLQILQRQAYQMKQLIQDLIDLSKASTGNMAVNLTRLDAVETVRQALGEFSDKLEAVHLNPVFHAPETPVYITADGRLLWRVLSNLLTNAIQYAMPDTRLYVQLRQEQDQVLLSLRNVSKEELCHSCDELMERFSQGDTSRQSGGSGLGLNIAQSLMQVQNGQFRLELDGDLFKVTLGFPQG